MIGTPKLWKENEAGAETTVHYRPFFSCSSETVKQKINNK